MFRLLTISLAIVGGCGGQVTEDTPPAPQWQRIENIQTQPGPVLPEIVKPVGSDFYVVKWTASGCPPCIQWDRSERASWLRRASRSWTSTAAIPRTRRR
jgi:hypothetical protein